MGNKSDLPDQQVSFDEAMALSKKYDCVLKLCSAKEGNGINEVFEYIAE